MNMQLLLGLWAAVFVAYLSVVVMRRSVGKQEDDHLHVFDSDKVVAAQSAIAHRLDVLDRWKTGLLVLLVVLGLLIGAIHGYNAWQASNTLPQVR